MCILIIINKKLIDNIIILNIECIYLYRDSIIKKYYDKTKSYNPVILIIYLLFSYNIELFKLLRKLYIHNIIINDYKTNSKNL